MKISESFTCPKCGCHHLDEVMANVTVTTPVTEVRVDDGEDDDDALDLPVATDYNYAGATNEDGEVLRYQCGMCGEVIATSLTDLYRLLKKQ